MSSRSDAPGILAASLSHLMRCAAKVSVRPPRASEQSVRACMSACASLTAAATVTSDDVSARICDYPRAPGGSGVQGLALHAHVHPMSTHAFQSLSFLHSLGLHHARDLCHRAACVHAYVYVLLRTRKHHAWARTDRPVTHTRTAPTSRERCADPAQIRRRRAGSGILQ